MPQVPDGKGNAEPHAQVTAARQFLCKQGGLATERMGSGGYSLFPLPFPGPRVSDEWKKASVSKQQAQSVAFENREKAAGKEEGGCVLGTEPGALDSILNLSKAEKEEEEEEVMLEQ